MCIRIYTLLYRNNYFCTYVHLFLYINLYTYGLYAPVLGFRGPSLLLEAPLKETPLTSGAPKSAPIVPPKGASGSQGSPKQGAPINPIPLYCGPLLYYILLYHRIWYYMYSSYSRLLLRNLNSITRIQNRIIYHISIWDLKLSSLTATPPVLAQAI